MHLSAGKLIVTKEKYKLFLDGRYLEKAHSCSILAELSTDSNILEFIPKDIKTITFDPDTTSYSQFLSLQKLFAPKKIVPQEFPFLTQLRSIKDQGEKEKLRRAAALCSEGFDYILGHLKEGVSEKELATILEIFWKERGADSLSFEPIIAFGANSAFPHHRSSSTRLKKGDIVLIDIGVTVDAYVSDMTRSVFFKEVDPKLKEIYFIVQEAQKEALLLCREGAPIPSLNRRATEVITKRGYEEFIRHGLGHGIGIEVHESPSLKDLSEQSLLATDMAITIEPGLYVRDLGGVRIENSLLITQDGYEDLTKRPTDLLVIIPK